ncbi:uncharacterized protein LOC143942639 isoform X2 [Lithobates pipiens]
MKRKYSNLQEIPEDIRRLRRQLSSYDDPSLRRIYEHYRDDLIYILENINLLHSVLVELTSRNVLNTEKYQPMEKDPSSFSHTLLQDIRDLGRKAVIGLWECLYELQKDHPHPNLLSVLDEITQTGSCSYCPQPQNQHLNNGLAII